MVKVLGAVAIGIVLGAAVAEVINRTKPNFAGNLGQKLKNGMAAVKDAFKEGYEQAAAPSDEAAPESAPAS
jgi:hypothetical protein